MLKKIKRVRPALKQRWTHHKNNRKLEKLAINVKENARSSSQAPVIFMGVSTRLLGMSLNAGFALLTKMSLQLQGVPVIQFVCDSGMDHCMLGSVIKNPLDKPPCQGCVRQSRKMYAHSSIAWFKNKPTDRVKDETKNLSIQQLINYQIDNLPLGNIVLPAIRWVLRRHHLQENEQTRILFRNYILAAESIARQFTELITREKPQKVVVFNGITFPEAVVRWIAVQNKIPVITYEVGLQPFSAFFSYEQATAYPIHVDDEFQLNDKQNKKLDHYLEQRFQGNFSMAGVRFWPTMRTLSESFLKNSARFKQIVPIFTNVIFDTSQSHANVIFENMFDWLNHLLSVIQNHPETLFVIRAHPDEARPGKASRESVAIWAKTHRVNTFPNVVFVDSTEYFSSYELIQKSKFVMVYNSTIGLEATLLNVPVLCAGKSRFTQLETVYFPQNQQRYLKLLEDFLTTDRVDLPQHFVDNTRRFLYVQLFGVSLPLNRYLEEDQIWQGYVQLKDFGWQDLLPENSDVMRVISDGILKGSEFVLDL